MTAHDLSLHLVTDERLAFPRLTSVVDAAVDAGVSVVQLRSKAAATGELLVQAIVLSRVIAGRAAFVVDDRLDIVLAARDAGARVDGIHLGQRDLPPRAARRLLGPESLIGWTANTPEHLAAAAGMPDGTIDYLGVGVIRPTATKPDHPAPLGIDGFAALAQRTAFPCVAIGGVTADDVLALRRVGAAGVAVVSAICGADDPRAATREFARSLAASQVPA
ncbi:thiamine phosphate synthase [Microbacterium sp. SS28]|uniref:thiamine phosphate synthase n=1 Tax=Microbacterium sp. SS28 TaxID=2919948 RepID=UPI001FAA34FC|nr:thiamine phosphate synthase [Microbacterium sp. SS28]